MDLSVLILLLSSGVLLLFLSVSVRNVFFGVMGAGVFFLSGLGLLGGGLRVISGQEIVNQSGSLVYNTTYATLDGATVTGFSVVLLVIGVLLFFALFFARFGGE